jgi:NAD(P)-dependent dehydrogenase (short-subunit alcohol dehydrogenase family)
MPTIAIVGAGPSLGLPIAQEFGARGFNVALISRNPDKLARLERALETDGITAASFPADVTDHEGLIQALTDAAAHFGGIDVLEYSPSVPSSGPLAPVDVLETTQADVPAQIEFHLYGAMTATQAVLPAMLSAGAGTLLFTSGITSVTPMPEYGNVAIGAAALRNWARNLAESLDGTGVTVAHVAIGVWLGDWAPDGFKHLPAAEIARRFHEIHATQSAGELVID